MTQPKSLHGPAKHRPSPDAEREFALHQLPSSRSAEVVAVESEHGAKRQLAQLGILVGARLRVVRVAPMGGPVLVEVSGSEVAIGRGLARHVRVRLL